MVLILSPFSVHQLLHAVRYACPRSLSVAKQNPARMIARSSANAKIFLSVFSRISSESSTMFHRNGDRTPPWGHPAKIQIIIETPLRFSLSFLVEMKCRIQLLTLPFCFCFCFLECPFYCYKGNVVKGSFYV